MLVLALFLTIAAAVECGDPVALETVDTRMDAAESAWRDLDEPAFRDAVNVLSGLLLPCIREVMPADRVARYHRLMAVYLQAGGDEAGAVASASAARRVAPDQAFDTTLLPVGHPVVVAYVAAPPGGSSRSAPEPRAGRIAFDGMFTRARPAGTPSIVQLFDDQGLAKSTAYLGPRAPLPAYVGVPRKRNALITCAGASAATAAGAWGWAGASRSSLYRLAADPATPAADLDARRAQANALSVVGGLFIATASGCGASAALIGSR